MTDGKPRMQIPRLFWRVLASGLTLLTVVSIEISRSAGVPPPIPFLALYATVVFAGLMGGIVGGAAASGMAAFYVIFVSFVGFGPPTLTGDAFHVTLGVVLFAATGVGLGHLRDQRDRLLAAVRHNEAVLEAEIARRTERLSATIEHLRLFRQYADTSADMLAMANAEGSMLAANGAFCAFFGLQPEYAAGPQIEEVFGADIYARLFREPVRRALAGESTLFDAQIEGAGIGMRWLDIAVLPLRGSSGGAPVGAVFSARDVTQRRASAAELEESRDHLRLIADNLPALIAHIDAGQRYRFINETGARWFGRSRERIVGQTIWDIHGENADRLKPGIVRAMSGERFLDNLKMTYPDGATRIIQAQYVPEIAASGSVVGYFVLCEDVTELRKVEERLVQAQKLEAIGQLTGGIAHDFNNLLAVVQGNADILIRQGNEDTRELAESIHDASHRGTLLIQRLLSFARRQPLRSAPVDCGKLLAGMRDMLVRTLGEMVTVEIAPAGELWTAEVDPAQLENAILNLAINGRDAMLGGGRLTIGCSNVRLSAGDVARIPDATPGEYVRISVRDSGLGMSPETATRAFEPFFTTKDVGEGSGLGLSMVYGFAQQSGGFATIESVPGVGSTVSILLPRAVRDAEPAAEDEEELIPQGDGEIVLVIEDDPRVRALVVRMLSGIGYRTVEAADVAEARRRVISGVPPVDLVLSDVVLPGGESGADFAAELMRDEPGLGVVLMSGYRTHRDPGAARLPRGVAFLDKPFRLVDLAKAIRSALTNGAAGDALKGSNNRALG